MLLKSLKISGFKSFGKRAVLGFPSDISAIVGPNGSGKSNVVEAIAWVLGEQSFKSLRGKKGQDLIFSGSQSAPRTSKASVALSFTRPGKEHVSISRTVYKDGINEYCINNSRCRLKDVVEFLSGLGLSTSRHHIINQGESDKILNVSPKDRREMIEDALGLRIYQIKRDEGKRKLERTEENMRQIQSLRTEIQPHLRFLKRQVDKASKVVVLKEKLKKLYFSYFFKLGTQLKKESKDIASEKKRAEAELSKILKSIAETKREISATDISREKDEGSRESVNLLEREIGRYEVMISQAKARAKSISSPGLKEMENFISKFEKDIERALDEKNIDRIRVILKGIKAEIENLFENNKEKSDESKELGLSALEEKYKELIIALKSAKEEEGFLRRERNRSIELERELYQAETRANGIKSTLQALKLKEAQVNFRREEMEKDMEEAEIIVGQKIEVLPQAGGSFSGAEEDWRAIERMKIRLEESGGIGEEILKEYEEIQARDDFLASELSDLGRSATSLGELIQQLDEKIDSDFKNGILKINEELERFFKLMFAGGRAELGVMDDGIDITVNLPKKRIISLNMLSGGERALTSIALLFAMSQVNPPPFLILDETDAALDEANSRKYAKLLRSLSSQTQLVLVTHNRETMEAAGVLYGVTMDGNGVSHLLSIKLEEARDFTGD